MAKRAQVDDGEPAVAEPDAPVGIDPRATIVRPAMSEGISHCIDESGLDRVCVCNNANNSAHDQIESFLKVDEERASQL
jgi:hypothetical protein